MAWIERQNRSCIRLQELPRGGCNISVESEESPQRREIVRCRGADHRLGRLVHQVGDALEVNRNVTALQERTREWPRNVEMSTTNDTRRNGEQVNIRERQTVRIVLHLRQIDRPSLLSLLNSSLSRQTSTAAEMRSAGPCFVTSPRLPPPKKTKKKTKNKR